jgi:hypothetical protein
MATAAGSTSQEYWRPSNPDVARVVTSIRGTCRRCGTDYSGGARYCHLCGSARDLRRDDAAPEPEALQEASFAEAAHAKSGLSAACTVCLAIAIVCALAAALTGVIYKEDTLVDWQAVQAWKIEWLLAAITALLAGILLKKKNGSN